MQLTRHKRTITIQPGTADFVNAARRLQAQGTITEDQLIAIETKASQEPVDRIVVEDDMLEKYDDLWDYLGIECIGGRK